MRHGRCGSTPCCRVAGTFRSRGAEISATGSFAAPAESSVAAVLGSPHDSSAALVDDGPDVPAASVTGDAGRPHDRSSGFGVVVTARRPDDPFEGFGVVAASFVETSGAPADTDGAAPTPFAVSLVFPAADAGTE